LLFHWADQEVRPTFEGEGDIGVKIEGLDDGKFGIGKRVEAIEPDGGNAADSLGGDAFGSELQAARAKSGWATRMAAASVRRWRTGVGTSGASSTQSRTKPERV
jgi:type IV secretory pathway TrbL component